MTDDTVKPVAWTNKECLAIAVDDLKTNNAALITIGSVRHQGDEPLYTQAAIDAAVAAERERCAMLCEKRAAWEDLNPAEALLAVAKAIRGRN